jgi:hypothetical protein
VKTEPNAPAFTTSLEQVYQGLTKREYFAAMALQGILSNASGIKDEAHWCKFAVIYADALIAELNKEKETK